MITSIEDMLRKGAEWPPKSEVERLETYYANTLLFEGKHPEVYKEASKAVRPELDVANLFVINWQKRLTRLWVGLMLGEPPKFTAGKPDSTEQKDLNKLLERTKFLEKLGMHRIDVSRYGDGLFKVWVRDGKVQIDVQPPQFWFPIVDAGNINNITAHVLAWKVEINEKTYLRTEIHTFGQIENRAYLLEGKVRTEIGREVSLETLGETRQRIEESPLKDRFMLVRISNLLTSTSPYGFNDYDDLDTLVLEMESRLAQMSKILDKHAEPGMYGPETALEYDAELKKWRFKKAGYLVLAEGDQAPGYLTWDGGIDDNLNMFNQLTETFFAISETSPANFGLLKAGLAESGSALKRLLIASITKNNMVRMSYDAGLKELFSLVTALEKNEMDVSITWRDGLPEDETETATNDTSYRTSGSRSLHQSLRTQHPDWDDKAIQEEADRITEEQAQQSAINPVGNNDTFNNPRAE